MHPAPTPPLPIDQLARKIRETALITGEFRLRSGATSTDYFDKYLFESDPELLYSIAHGLNGLLTMEFDLLAALEMGGIPVGTMLAHVARRKVLFIRKTAKEYGTCRYAEGGTCAEKRLLIVEDVVSTGGAIIDAVGRLRRDGAIVDSVLCVIDRDSGGRQNLEREGLRLIPLFTYAQLA